MIMMVVTAFDTMKAKGMVNNTQRWHSYTLLEQLSTFHYTPIESKAFIQVYAMHHVNF